MRLLALLVLLAVSAPAIAQEPLAASHDAQHEEDVVVDDSGASRRGDTLGFAAAMTTCAAVSTGLALLGLIPEARSQPSAVYVISAFPGAALAHVDVLVCPAIAMALAGPSGSVLFAELVLGAALGLLAGGEVGAAVVWPVDQLSLGRPPAATLAMGGAFLLGSIGTTVGSILAYELHHGHEQPVSMALTPLDGGLLATCWATW
jgi:hypothetical protein